MLYKRGKVYYIDFRYKGKRYRETTNETSYDKAIVIYNEFKRQLNAHTIKKGITFNEAALLFLEGKIRQGLSPQTIKKYKEHFKYFKEFFEKKTIDEIDKKAVQDYEHCKMAGGTRAEYMRIQLQSLQTFFNYLNEMELTANNPFTTYKFKKYLPKYKARIRFLTPSECQRLIDCCNENLKRLVIFLLETGCRIGETLKLQESDVCIDEKGRQYLHLRQEITKGRKARIAPLSKKAAEQIKRQLLENKKGIEKGRADEKGIIFLNSKKKAYRTEPKKAFANALIRAGLKERYGLFHLLRHTAGSLWLQGLNVDGTQRTPLKIELISEILGHSNINITKSIYAKYDKQDIIDAFYK